MSYSRAKKGAGGGGVYVSDNEADTAQQQVLLFQGRGAVFFCGAGGSGA